MPKRAKSSPRAYYELIDLCVLFKRPNFLLLCNHKKLALGVDKLPIPCYNEFVIGINLSVLVMFYKSEKRAPRLQRGSFFLLTKSDSFPLLLIRDVL